MGNTDCNVLIKNNTRWEMKIDIDDNDNGDWEQGPVTILNKKIVAANSSENYTLCSKDSHTRCWFQMNNKFYDPKVGINDKNAFHIGMTHIELKTNDKDKQARKGTCTEIYTEFKIKVTIEMETPVTGVYKLNIQYDSI